MKVIAKSTPHRHKWMGQGLDVVKDDLVWISECAYCGTRRSRPYTRKSRWLLK